MPLVRLLVDGPRISGHPDALAVGTKGGITAERFSSFILGNWYYRPSVRLHDRGGRPPLRFVGLAWIGTVAFFAFMDVVQKKSPLKGGLRCLMLPYS
jgi:hypothetical protein